MKEMLTLTRCTVYFLVTVALFLFLQASFADQLSHKEVNSWDAQPSGSQNPHGGRQRRAIAVRKPGFFWTLGSSIFQQFNETRSAYQQVRNLINGQFTDERKPARTKATPPAPTTTMEPGATTTAAPYRISRAEFNRILMRNLRGIARLYNLELADALKQSEQNRADFNKQLRVSIKKELS